jgi:hypothetical protein
LIPPGTEETICLRSDRSPKVSDHIDKNDFANHARLWLC